MSSLLDESQRETTPAELLLVLTVFAANKMGSGVTFKAVTPQGRVNGSFLLGIRINVEIGSLFFFSPFSLFVFS